MVSSSDDVVLALKETLRYGLFLGTFAGTFVSVDEIVSSWGGHRRYVTVYIFMWIHTHLYLGVCVLISDVFSLLNRCD